MNWLVKLFGKDIKTFLRFSLVGAVWTVLNIGSDVILIDNFGLPGWIGALAGYVVLYVGRFYSYLLLNVIQPQFWKYVFSTIAFTLVMWGLKVVAIDILDYPAIIASPIITIIAFIFKYFYYKSIDLIKTSSSDTD